ncbi:unnamed protein product (macronuclear) [Paramecium tetraurelia]|uniref:Uncharacterized protein n=1 Tax=Paramecium tetraurelia TaxID=5888 RepID=A0CZJ4_PARTE|nr:uncharacterized protein GSPATT00011784001 [Paramecium tetraurelia]CAK76211.1 unnamed protein product [Paramecium tetraurelia]|eukprot:XP_001443608.1 hypothetical protein (macronuclear) [Paramecium tetraurelia strain d4-2]
MRSQSLLLSPQNYQLNPNLLTPTQKRYISQLSTGQNKSSTSQTEEFQLYIPQLVSEKQEQFQTVNNYYNPNSITYLKLSESPQKILFKTGYEQQIEIKELNQENQNLKEIVKKQEDQLHDLGNILELNQQLKDKLLQLQQENDILLQKKEQHQKNSQNV